VEYLTGLRKEIRLQISNALRLGVLCFAVANAVGYAQAQSIPPIAPATRPAAVAAQRSPNQVPTNLTDTFLSYKEIDLTWTAVSGATNYSIDRCSDANCGNFQPAGTSTTNFFSDHNLTPMTTYTYRVAVSGSNVHSESFSETTTRFTCSLLPTRPACTDFGDGLEMNVNNFYNTSGTHSYFNQIKSLYNGASSSATVSADLASLNFLNGMQVKFVTNVQAGPSGSATASSGPVPILSSNGAAQATQNMLSGGTVYAAVLYPIFAMGADRLGKPGSIGMIFDGVAKEGADVQNFKSGTNVNVTSPPSHTSAQIEGYLQYNSTQSANSTSAFTGAVFVGGSYGYSYTSHGYARDYGFGNRVHNDIGQISVGILINGVANISVSRAFGPPQIYINSTSMTQAKVNNFKAWSFGITYQSAPASK
jgi:hypothetical protein